jgi:hypothetical protein
LSGARVIATALAIAIAATAGVSCDATVPDEGRDASLQVAGAQFFRSAMPAEAAGPAVRSVSVSPIVQAGASGRRCSGEVDPQTSAVAIALAGDLGYWIVPAKVPDVSAPGFPTFAAELSFSAKLAPGERDLLVRAVDGSGHFGAAAARPLAIASRIPQGKLVVSLAWDDGADLDLHVVDPSGVEIDKRNINSYQPPPPGAPPEAPGTPHVGGVLDFDSNAGCVPDGLRREDVVWADEPPRGHYIVRVDTASMCGEAAARWRVEVLANGVAVAAAEGASTDNDTRFAHELGSGVLALEFDVP